MGILREGDGDIDADSDKDEDDNDGKNDAYPACDTLYKVISQLSLQNYTVSLLEETVLEVRGKVNELAERCELASFREKQERWDELTSLKEKLNDQISKSRMINFQPGTMDEKNMKESENDIQVTENESEGWSFGGFMKYLIILFA